MQASETEISRALETLKRLLRAHGLHYRDVAEALSVSERSVQRWFGGESITVQILAALCGLIEISLAELFVLSGDAVDPRPRSISHAQEQALVDSPLALFIFTRLLQGWTPSGVQAACAISEPDLVRSLLNLERMGLIEVHPGNRVRLLTRTNIEWRRDGPMRAYFDQFVKALVARTDFGEADSIWRSDSFHLTAKAAIEMEARLHALRLEMRAIAEVEAGAAPAEKRWYSMVLFAYRHDLDRPNDPLSRILGAGVR